MKIGDTVRLRQRLEDDPPAGTLMRVERIYLADDTELLVSLIGSRPRIEMLVRADEVEVIE